MTIVDTSSNLHPYECDGIGHCIHCDRTHTDSHDPCDCALCADDESVRVVGPVPQGADIEETALLAKRVVAYDEALAESETQIIGKPRDLQELASSSRIDVAHKVHAEALQRVVDLCVQTRLAFDELEKSVALMHEIGSEVGDSLPKPFDSAWAAWRNEKR